MKTKYILKIGASKSSSVARSFKTSAKSLKTIDNLCSIGVGRYVGTNGSYKKIKNGGISPPFLGITIQVVAVCIIKSEY